MLDSVKVRAAGAVWRNAKVSGVMQAPLKASASPTHRAVCMAEDIIIRPHTEWNVEAALNPPVKGIQPYTATIEPSASQSMLRLQARGIKVTSVDTVGLQSPVRARLVNFSDQPVLVTMNTYIGDARPARPDEIIELPEANAFMLEQKLLQVLAAHHSDNKFRDAARLALQAIEREKSKTSWVVKCDSRMGFQGLHGLTCWCWVLR